MESAMKIGIFARWYGDDASLLPSLSNLVIFHARVPSLVYSQIASSPMPIPGRTGPGFVHVKSARGSRQ